MSQRNHTPGPWEAIQTSLDQTITRVVWGDGFNTPLAWVYTEDPTGRANAALIAAAPDLLAAVEGIVNQAENAPSDECADSYLCNILDIARAAIAKVKGGA